MKTNKIAESSKLILGINDICRLLSVTKQSAYVSANRYVKLGFLFRLKKDVYILSSRWNSLSEEEMFEIANVLQVPSYVSLGSSLSYYNVTTQQQRKYIESIALKRTVSFVKGGTSFTYSKIKKEFYTGFVRNESFFIALPEKALADVIYLVSINKYSFDFSSLDFKKVNKEKISEYLLKTNKEATKYWNRLCSTYKI
ncbi:MAG: hypothetical protein AB1521_08800 [Bacteroidota bacterium]